MSKAPCSRSSGASFTKDDSRSRHRLRPWLTLLFAVVLMLVASWASAQPPSVEPSPSNSTSHSGLTAASERQSLDAGREDQGAFGCYDPSQQRQEVATGGAVPRMRVHDRPRPKYVEVTARLANFDADSDPDGWRAEVALRDAGDNPVSMRAWASFELMPRIPLDDFRATDARTLPVRWSIPLRFDPDGIARVKLPLQAALRPMLGPEASARTGSKSLRTVSMGSLFPTAGAEQATRLDEQRVGMSWWGELKLRVSVPTEGVFETAVPVQVRPSVLVDTQWPYR